MGSGSSYCGGEIVFLGLSGLFYGCKSFFMLNSAFRSLGSLAAGALK